MGGDGWAREGRGGGHLLSRAHPFALPAALALIDVGIDVVTSENDICLRKNNSMSRYIATFALKNEIPDDIIA